MADPVPEMPEPGVFDIEDEEAKARAIAEAESEVAAGRGIPYEKVRAWLLELAAGRRCEPPTA